MIDKENLLDRNPPSRLAKLFEPFAALSMSTKLVAGFATLSLVAVMVGVTGLYFIDKINATLNNISDVAAPTVETSDDLIALIFEATKVAEEIIADEDPADIDTLYIELNSLNVKFGESYNELQLLVIDESLLDELETARIEQTEFVDHANSMVAAHRLELQKEREGYELLALFDATGAQLVSALDEFAIENEAEMAKAEAEGDELEARDADGASVNRVLGDLFDQDYPVVEAALKLQRLIIEMQDTAGEYLAAESATELPTIETDFLALYASVKPHLNVLRDLAETDEDRSDTIELEQMLQTWVSIATTSDQLFETHKLMLQAEALADELTENFETDADNVVRALDKVAATADAISDGADEAAESAVRQASTTILGLLLAAVIFSSLLLLLMMITVIMPIRSLTDAMVSLGARYGPVTVPTQRTGDEVSRLWKTFDYLELQVRQRTADLQQRTTELDSVNKDLEEELIRRQTLEQQLVHAQKLEGLGTLAGGIAHDFNNMLYVILGCSKMMLSELSEDGLIRSLTLKIDGAAQRSKSIVDQILFFSRQDNPDRELINIGKATRDSVTLLRAGLPTSVTLDMRIDENCGMVFADKTQVHQLVVNLITNAYQSHVDGKGTITVAVEQITIDAEFAARHLELREGQYIRLQVVDEGVGIPEELRSKIFDPFFTTKPVGEGTGLGLAVVHGIVKGHDGVIVVSSGVERGTVFEVFLPVWKKQAKLDKDMLRADD